MSATLVRTLMALCLLFSAPAVCTMILIAGTEMGGYSAGRFEFWFNLGVMITGVYYSLGWFKIWQPIVKWTPERKGKTWGITLGLVLMACVVWVMTNTAIGDSGVSPFFAGVFYLLSWTFAMVYIWRETSTERIDRMQKLGLDAIVCPACGYNMTGLKSTICPECGKAYTVDQLFACVMESKSDVMD